MRNAVAKPLLLVAVFAALSSCADFQPEKAEPADAIVTPNSKPVKMPPTNRKLGSSEGIGLDDFFAAQQSGNALIYDVRIPYFYAIDHIPGAINWPYTHYEAQVQKRDIEIQKALKEGKQVVLYCFSLTCPEARNVAKNLARRDYDVRVLSMGIDSWREAGLPLETAKGAE
jgi:rhodanese-related sulfurtransferase